MDAAFVREKTSEAKGWTVLSWSLSRKETPTAGAQSICLLSLPEDPLDWKRQDKETDG